MKLLGIHHITAIAGEPQQNLDFYAGVLGLRFVKRTVNFDDPSSYHFYFGDRTGRPGTALTFFPWPGAQRGTRGTGQVVATSFAIPSDAIDFWKDRFKQQRVLSEEIAERFGDVVLRFADPDGLILELIASANPDDVDLEYKSDVPREFAIHGFHTPTFEVRKADKTIRLLEMLGFELLVEDETRHRFSVNQLSTSSHVDVVERPGGAFGVNSAGTVHHIAFRCADEDEQLHWREKVAERGLHVTPVIDRQYFHSIYFREPGGILFEIATDKPGFTADEPVESLGESLKLPPQYEAHREEIARSLPPITLP